MCAGKGQSAVDHIKSHNGDEALFWDEDNLQLLCKPCHDQHKQKIDKAARLRY
ncbi:HNH endonuclease signature motif containing protein [Agrobacterium pusense]|uniref:HNH endonuclease signature motif containing protein n=1 Tax=Agrobacterium pusense TaxID=648995 RepID=UPI001F412527|nr:HNH endonuclease signature motif containing protein [Agrobacterium pusense]WCK25574.1 HNH endonuclease signature motif containing protein [Agrobacterium pusense]